jgi:hypothetical protein
MFKGETSVVPCANVNKDSEKLLDFLERLRDGVLVGGRGPEGILFGCGGKGIIGGVGFVHLGFEEEIRLTRGGHGTASKLESGTVKMFQCFFLRNLVSWNIYCRKSDE